MPSFAFTSPEPADDAQHVSAALADACRALWLATLGLMTAYMQTPAPAHRFLLARRIAGNLDTLSRQQCFAGDCRATFGRLSRRWERRADEVQPGREQPRGWRRLLPV